MLNRRSDIFSLPIILFFLCVASQAIADKFPIANSASPETSYDIAFDGTNFLVAIEAETIGAQLVSPSGELVGSFISTGRSGRSSGRRLDGTGPGFPHVAFDGTNYLLVWTEGTSESVREHVLVGQFVSPSGSTVGEPFEINSAALEASVRGIAYGDGQYMVAYSQRPFGDAQTSSYYSRTVSSDGDVGPEFSYTCPDPDDECRRGDDSIRAIAFAQSTFLLVWVDRTPPNFPVLGKSLSSSGRLGAEFTINASPAPSNENSTVGTDGTNFLVVWADNVGEPGAPDWELFGQLISPFGDPIGDVISVVEIPATNWNRMSHSMASTISSPGQTLPVWIQPTTMARVYVGISVDSTSAPAVKGLDQKLLSPTIPVIRFFLQRLPATGKPWWLGATLKQSLEIPQATMFTATC